MQSYKHPFKPMCKNVVTRFLQHEYVFGGKKLVECSSLKLARFTTNVMNIKDQKFVAFCIFILFSVDVTLDFIYGFGS